MFKLFTDWLGMRPLPMALLNLLNFISMEYIEHILQIISLLLGILLSILTAIGWFRKNKSTPKS